MKIDHIELQVPDQKQAAAWYEQVLGFRVMSEHLDWAVEGGPLMMTNDGGETKLALFVGEPQGDAKVRGFRRLAFRVTAQELAAFVSASGEWREEPLGAAHRQDHGKAISYYFTDPYGNPIEVTTYEYEAAKRALG